MRWLIIKSVKTTATNKPWYKCKTTFKTWRISTIWCRILTISLSNKLTTSTKEWRPNSCQEAFRAYLRDNNSQLHISNLLCRVCRICQHLPVACQLDTMQRMISLRHKATMVPSWRVKDISRSSMLLAARILSLIQESISLPTAEDMIRWSHVTPRRLCLSKFTMEISPLKRTTAAKSYMTMLGTRVRSHSTMETATARAHRFNLRSINLSNLVAILIFSIDFVCSRAHLLPSQTTTIMTTSLSKKCSMKISMSISSRKWLEYHLSPILKRVMNASSVSNLSSSSRCNRNISQRW